MNVKELREKKGLTQAELSEKSGIPRDRIAKWEQGKGSPRAADEKKLDLIFGKSLLEQLPQNGAVVQNKPQHGGKSQNQGIDPAKEIKRLNDRQITIEAKIDVLFDVAVELLSATSGESGTLIRKKLEKRVDELKKFAQ